MMHKTTAAIAVSIAFKLNAATVFESLPLPAGNLPDTEVATNVALNVNLAKVQEVRFTLEAVDCSSNEVIAAVGCDADQDGDLAYGEAAFFFGLDCGQRYFVDCASGETDTAAGETISIKARDFNPEWNLMKIIKRGTGSVGESVTIEAENKKFVIYVR